MIIQLKNVITRAPGTFLEDAIGVAAIFVMLLVGLSLPGLS
ncbi:MAG: hypothetical protein QNL16_14925 [Rhodobacterales bacterium]|jgi:hypothetical protein|nr:hypothetical protein [Pseudomonadota bacterium]MDA1286653.1 hypothetical protein [Pseudomonadota bacterium]